VPHTFTVKGLALTPNHSEQIYIQRQCFLNLLSNQTWCAYR